MSENNSNTIFNDRGGIYLPNAKVHVDFLKFCDDHINIIRKRYPKLPQIECVIINNELLNATAAKARTGEYYIGFNIGLVDAISDIFLKMNSAKISKQEFDLYLSRGDYGVQYDTTARQANHALHPDGKRITDYQVILIYKFILYHEVCHILRGHVDLVSREFNAVISENDTDENIEKVSYLQTLEMDADSFAINRLYGELMEEFVSRDHPYFGELYRSLVSYSYYQVYSLYTFFRLFGFGKAETRRDNKLSHPIPSVRMSMALTTIGTIFATYDLNNKDLAIGEIWKALRFADEDFCRISYFDSEFEKFYHIFHDPKTVESMNGVSANWGELHKKLSELTFAPLPDILDNTIKI